MRALLNTLTVTIILIILLCGCGEVRTGFYTVDQVRGYTVTFKGKKGDYHVPTDTLRTGDRIFIQRVKRENQANVW